jgi:hypothetical protein
MRLWKRSGFNETKEVDFAVSMKMRPWKSYQNFDIKFPTQRYSNLTVKLFLKSLASQVSMRPRFSGFNETAETFIFVKFKLG